MHPALRELSHRPWPLPETKWIWRQSWLDLAFVHYRVSAESLRPRLPPGLHLQEFDGSAWVGLVPFRMSGVMRRPFPDTPFFSQFPELNLRVYVEAEGKPGVWFFSLDADSWPIVWGGRIFYGLPYFSARMVQRRSGDWLEFTSERRRGDARFAARYRPHGAVFYAKPGGFEHWIAERYCLYTFGPRRGLRRVNVHHRPWPLQRAEFELQRSDILQAAGIDAHDAAPVCHYSAGVDVVSYAIEDVAVSKGHGLTTS